MSNSDASKGDKATLDAVPAQQEDQHVVRAVGNMERYSVSRHNALFYIGIASYLTLQATNGVFDYSVLEPQLKAAIEHTALRHGNLRMKLVDPRGSKPGFSRWEDDSEDDQEKFLPVPRYVASSNVIQELENELRTPFDVEKGEMWRVTVVGEPKGKEFHLVVAAHHAISDGKSSMVILQTLVRFLALGTAPKMTVELDSDSGKSFESNAVEKICKGVRVPISVLLWEVFENLLLPSFLRPYVSPKDYYAGSKQLPADSPTLGATAFTKETLPPTKLQTLTLAPEQLKSLLAACKRNSTTLQGCLVAAAGQAVATASAKQKSTKVRVSSPVCLRSESQVPETEVVVCISSTDFDTKLSSDRPSAQQFWNTAKKARDSVIKGKATSALYTLALLGYVGDDFDGFILKAGLGTPNRKGATCEVSNAMSWSSFPEVTVGRSKWKVVSGGFSQSSSPMGSMINMSTVSVEGVLSITAGVRGDGLVEDAELKAVLDEMNALLLEVSK